MEKSNMFSKLFGKEAKIRKDNKRYNELKIKFQKLEDKFMQGTINNKELKMRSKIEEEMNKMVNNTSYELDSNGLLVPIEDVNNAKKQDNVVQNQEIPSPPTYNNDQRPHYTPEDIERMMLERQREEEIKFAKQQQAMQQQAMQQQAMQQQAMQQQAIQQQALERQRIEYENQQKIIAQQQEHDMMMAQKIDQEHAIMQQQTAHQQMQNSNNVIVRLMVDGNQPDFDFELQQSQVKDFNEKFRESVENNTLFYAGHYVFAGSKLIGYFIFKQN